MYGQHTRLENEILNKILSYHFLVESYTFFCIFCQARPRVSDCVFHATVTVGPGDEAGPPPQLFGGKLYAKYEMLDKQLVGELSFSLVFLTVSIALIPTR